LTKSIYDVHTEGEESQAQVDACTCTLQDIIARNQLLFQ